MNSNFCCCICMCDLLCFCLGNYELYCQTVIWLFGFLSTIIYTCISTPLIGARDQNIMYREIHHHKKKIKIVQRGRYLDTVEESDIKCNVVRAYLEYSVQLLVETILLLRFTHNYRVRHRKTPTTVVENRCRFSSN